LATLLALAQPFINSQDGEQRKNGATKLRQAIERFSKELLVRSRHAQGEQLAMITEKNAVSELKRPQLGNLQYSCSSRKAPLSWGFSAY
jgi:hypothetical protein